MCLQEEEGLMRFDHLRRSAVCPVDKSQDRGLLLLVLLPRSMWKKQAAAVGSLCVKCCCQWKPTFVDK